MPFFGGTRAVIRDISEAQETGYTHGGGIGDRNVQLYATGGILKGQYNGHPPCVIADLTCSQETATGVPAGAIFLWMGQTAPAGYLLCDGSSVSSVTFTSLFATIGTEWGTGDDPGSTFNVPNLAGRVPVGAGAPTFHDTWDGALSPGATGGELGTELTNRHLPLHNHELPATPEHTHPVPSATVDSDGLALTANHAHNFDVDVNASEPYDSDDADAYLIDHFVGSAPYDSGDATPYIIDYWSASEPYNSANTTIIDDLTTTEGDATGEDVTGESTPVYSIAGALGDLPTDGGLYDAGDSDAAVDNLKSGDDPFHTLGMYACCVDSDDAIDTFDSSNTYDWDGKVLIAAWETSEIDSATLTFDDEAIGADATALAFSDDQTGAATSATGAATFSTHVPATNFDGPASFNTSNSGAASLSTGSNDGADITGVTAASVDFSDDQTGSATPATGAPTFGTHIGSTNLGGPASFNTSEDGPATLTSSSNDGADVTGSEAPAIAFDDDQTGSATSTTGAATFGTHIPTTNFSGAASLNTSNSGAASLSTGSNSGADVTGEASPVLIFTDDQTGSATSTTGAATFGTHIPVTNFSGAASLNTSNSGAASLTTGSNSAADVTGDSNPAIAFTDDQTGAASATDVTVDIDGETGNTSSKTTTTETEPIYDTFISDWTYAVGNWDVWNSTQSYYFMRAFDGDAPNDPEYLAIDMDHVHEHEHTHDLDNSTVTADHAHTHDLNLAGTVAAHTHSIPDHTHSVDVDVLDHYHVVDADALDHSHSIDTDQFGHTHAVSAHTHDLDLAGTTAAHTHSIPDHTHPIDAETLDHYHVVDADALDHSHSIDTDQFSHTHAVSAHTHDLDLTGTVAAHTHSIPDHTHTIDAVKLDHSHEVLSDALDHSHSIDTDQFGHTHVVAAHTHDLNLVGTAAAHTHSIPDHTHAIDAEALDHYHVADVDALDHSHTIDTDQFGHTHTVNSHTHDLNLAGTHAHTHALDLAGTHPHTHTVPAEHYHRVEADHVHQIPDHRHTVAAAHSHSISGGAHTHTIDHPSHTHTIDIPHMHRVPSAHWHKVPAAHHHAVDFDGQSQFTAAVVSGDITIPANTTGVGSMPTAPTSSGQAGEAIPDKVSTVQPYIVVNYIIKV